MAHYLEQALSDYPLDKAKANIRGRTTEVVIREAAIALREGADPDSLPALILALEARFDAKAARREAKAAA